MGMKLVTSPWVHKGRAPGRCLPRGCTHSPPLLLILTERGMPECMRAVTIAELSPSPSSTAPCSHHKTEKRRAAVRRREREVFQCLLLPEQKPVQATLLVLFLLLRKCQPWCLLLHVLLTRVRLSQGVPGLSVQLIPSLCCKDSPFPSPAKDLQYWGK